MAIFFQDNFDGVGNVPASSPTTGFNGFNWTQPTAPILGKNSGYAKKTSGFGLAYATYGDQINDYSNPSSATFSAILKTASLADSEPDSGHALRIMVMIGGIFIQAEIDFSVNGSALDGIVTIYDDYAGLAQSASISGLLPETEYSVQFNIGNNAQSLIINGVTLYNSIPFVDATGCKYIRIGLDGGYSLSSITGENLLASINTPTISASNLHFTTQANAFELPSFATSSINLSSTTQNIRATYTASTSAMSFASATGISGLTKSHSSSALIFSSRLSVLPTKSASNLLFSGSLLSRLFIKSASKLTFSSESRNARHTYSFGQSALRLASLSQFAADASTSTIGFGSNADSERFTISASVSSLVFGGALAGQRQAMSHAKSSLTLESATAINGTTRTHSASNFILSSRSYFETLYEAWVMNSQTKAMSRYDGLLYKSVAVIGDRVIALGDTGFFELDVKDDASVPVKSKAVTGMLRLGSDKLKRVGSAYIGYTTTQPVSITVREYGDNKAAYTYALPSRTADAPRTGKVKFGGGLRSQYYQFSIEGQSLNLDYAELEVFSSDTRKV